MEELIIILDEKLEYKAHKIEEAGVYIYVKSTRKNADCPAVRNRAKCI